MHIPIVFIEPACTAPFSLFLPLSFPRDPGKASSSPISGWEQTLDKARLNHKNQRGSMQTPSDDDGDIYTFKYTSRLLHSSHHRQRTGDTPITSESLSFVRRHARTHTHTHTEKHQLFPLPCPACVCQARCCSSERTCLPLRCRIALHTYTPSFFLFSFDSLLTMAMTASLLERAMVRRLLALSKRREGHTYNHTNAMHRATSVLSLILPFPCQACQSLVVVLLTGWRGSDRRGMDGGDDDDEEEEEGETWG